MTASQVVVVFRTQSAIEADVVRGLLRTRGIGAITSPDVPQTIFPLGGLSGASLAVRAEEADRARELLTHLSTAAQDKLFGSNAAQLFGFSA